jgi:HEAT repeat protein
MDYAVTFARHFSRLIWLLMHEPQAFEEQKSSLRSLVSLSQEGLVMLGLNGGHLMVNDELLADAITGVAEVRAQFVGHAVQSVAVEMAARPADILGTARALATPVGPGDRGRTAEAALRELGPRSVRVIFEPREEPTPGDFPVAAFSATNAAIDHPAAALAALDATTSVTAASRLIDQLIGLIQRYARDRRLVDAADLWSQLVRREAAATDPDTRLAYAAAIRRLTTPTLLRDVAMMLPRQKDRTEDLVTILARTGDEGAEAVIEELATAQSRSDRRVYFDALVRLNAGVHTLTHLLGDPRWYVTRNAADLLGELNATEADVRLADLLAHDDDRVRRAAANALGKLQTPKALAALRRALNDTSLHVRATAAAGLGMRKGHRASDTLVAALESERDVEVQIAILMALGRTATPDAVDRLVKAAESGSVFKRKPTAYRVAAVQALSDARTHAALSALRALTSDKEDAVRDAATRALAQSPPA